MRTTHFLKTCKTFTLWYIYSKSLESRLPGGVGTHPGPGVGGIAWRAPRSRPPFLDGRVALKGSFGHVDS